jgi:hypothetical protein
MLSLITSEGRWMPVIRIAGKYPVPNGKSSSGTAALPAPLFRPPYQHLHERFGPLPHAIAVRPTSECRCDHFLQGRPAGLAILRQSPLSALQSVARPRDSAL